MNSSLVQDALWLTFLADDFTGATDALERLELSGVRTAVYMATPSPEVIASRPELRAVGVAGVSRSLPTEAIAAAVRPALESLRNLGAAHVHYKVCSTFDSSPRIGSIGLVIDMAAELFDAPFTPVVVASPEMGRWCVFGNLFAGMGVGADSPAYRLDRHPSISRHPVTPMEEADLRVHLSRQTGRRIGLIDVRTLDRPLRDADRLLRELIDSRDSEIILFDTLNLQHLTAIGGLLAPYGSSESPLFWIGSSAVESALTAQWREAGVLQELDLPCPSAIDGPPLVFVGSCSPVTAAQVTAAAAAGLEVVELPAHIFTDDGSSKEARDNVLELARASLGNCRGVLVTTPSHVLPRKIAPEVLGQVFANTAMQCLREAHLGLIVVAGGDTASYTARAMGIEFLEFDAPLTPGAPICRAGSPNPLVDGVRVVFKGGQVGRPDFFTTLNRTPSQSA